jgi:hypothetical protein
MNQADRFKFRGTYRTPDVRVGYRIRCEARGYPLLVTGFSDGTIRWPVGRSPGSGGSGLIVFGELAAAVRTELANAVAIGWGITRQTVSRFRRELGVGPSSVVRAARSATAKARNKSPNGRPWTAEEDEGVRTLSPTEAARKCGRTVRAIYNRRAKLRLRDLRPDLRLVCPFRTRRSGQ